MGLSSFFQQLGTQAGATMQATQAYDLGQAELASRQLDAPSKQADIEAKHAAAAREKMSAAASQDVGTLIKSMQDADKSIVQSPAKMSQVYSAAANKAIQDGAPDLAVKMSALAKGQLDMAKASESVLTEKVAQSKEDLSKAAIDFGANPSQEGMRDVAEKAIRAGVDPTKIPTDATKFQAWAKAQETAALDTKTQLAAREKAREFDQKAKENALRHREIAESAAANRSLKALLTESIIEKNKATTAKFSSTDGGGMSKPERMNLGRAITSAAEAVRQLDNQEAMSPKATASAFANLKDTELLTALTRAGTTAITPEQSQLLQANSAILAKAIGNATTAKEGGRAFTETQVADLKKAVSRQAGETELVGLFKEINAKEELHILMKGTKHPEEEYRKLQEETLRKTEVPVTTKQLLTFARKNNPLAYNQMLRSQETMGDAITKLGEVSRSSEKPAPLATPKSGVMSAEDWLNQK